MLQKIEIKFSDKNIKLIIKGTNFFSRFSGLMFRSRSTNNLLFDFRREVRFSIHSFFVFFPFLAIWLDSNNKVVEYKVVRPFCLNVKPRGKFIKIVEIPLNRRNKPLIKKIIN